MSLRGRRWKEESGPGAGRRTPGRLVRRRGERNASCFTPPSFRKSFAAGGTCSCFSPITRRQALFSSAALSESFPGAVFWYGSSLPEKKKAETYFRARAEGGRLILGNKSCVFLPLLDNGLVIIERPEEDEYRNEEAFRFNAVRLAVRRAEIEGVRAVLGSAAPPLEVLKWAAEGVVDVVEGRPIERPPVLSMRGDKSRGAPFVRARRNDMRHKGGPGSMRKCRYPYAAKVLCGKPFLRRVRPTASLPDLRGRRRSATIRQGRRWPAAAARAFSLMKSGVPTAAPNPSCSSRSARNTWRRG